MQPGLNRVSGSSLTEFLTVCKTGVNIVPLMCSEFCITGVSCFSQIHRFLWLLSLLSYILFYARYLFCFQTHLLKPLKAGLKCEHWCSSLFLWCYVIAMKTYQDALYTCPNAQPGHKEVTSWYAAPVHVISLNASSVYPIPWAVI